MSDLLSRLWKRCRHREGRWLRLLGIGMLLLGILYRIDAETTVPAEAVVVDLEFTKEMQEFVQRNEEYGAEFRQNSSVPRKNPGIIIVYENTKASEGVSPLTQSTPPESGMSSSMNTERQHREQGTVRSGMSGTGRLLKSSARSRERLTNIAKRVARKSARMHDRNRAAPRGNAVVTMRLVRDDGIVLFPRYHFGSGSTRVILDERRFRPGFYTLEGESTDVQTGERETVAQTFAWGVLAMNTDQDRYDPGATAEIHIGALDAHGEIVCDADLALTVTSPSGASTILQTKNHTIETTGTCGLKKGGLLSPDYRAAYRFEDEGRYSLSLKSAINGHSATIDSVITVSSASPFVIRRTAATRLWPFAPSTMDMDVEFREAFSGWLQETVPRGFVITKTDPEALIGTDPRSGDRTLRWQGTWEPGTLMRLSYTYDAPDISPEFYLLGPLMFFPWTATGSGMLSGEMRSWQIANDSASVSANYDIIRDAVVAGGGEVARSGNYQLSDTIGEPGAGILSSTNYTLEGGYRTTIEHYASLSCWTTLDLGSIPGVGQATAEASCSVITDAPAGYTLSWQVTTGSGGTATGYMINQFEDTIAPFSPITTNTPETWSISASTAEWGGRLRSSSTDVDAKWGTDGVSEKWLNVGSGSSVSVVSRSSRTAITGSTEQLQFRTEVGSSRVQPKGTYAVNVEFFLDAP